MNGDTKPSSWRKSTYSSGNDNCLEIATDVESVVSIRDSKNPLGPVLQLSSYQWRLFIGGLRSGDFNPV